MWKIIIITKRLKTKKLSTFHFNFFFFLTDFIYTFELEKFLSFLGWEKENKGKLLFSFYTSYIFFSNFPLIFMVFAWYFRYLCTNFYDIFPENFYFDRWKIWFSTKWFLFHASSICIKNVNFFRSYSKYRRLESEIFQKCRIFHTYADVLWIPISH